jgi:hypothetical protein
MVINYEEIQKDLRAKLYELNQQKESLNNSLQNSFNKIVNTQGRLDMIEDLIRLRDAPNGDS